MITPVVSDPGAWAQQQFGGVNLGDVRLNRRACSVAVSMAKLPGASLPKQMQGNATLKAMYGLLHNEKVTHEGLVAPQWHATRAVMAKEPLTLLVMDVTELDLTHFAKTMRGLDYLRDGGYGELVHSTLAVRPAPRQVIGLAHQQIFAREPIPEGQNPRNRPQDERESRVWGESLQALGHCPDGSRQVVVGDRALDFALFLRQCGEIGYGYVVRLAYNRRLTDESATENACLMTTARTWAAVAGKYVDIPANKKHKARRAKLLVSYGQVTVRGPGGEGSLSFFVVRVWEVDPPEGVEPLEWFLATNVSVGSAEDALERVEWYECRWVIEDYHQCLKTGCGIEERDLEDVESLKRLLGWYAPLAVRLLQLRENARLNPDLPASAVVDELTVRILAVQRKVNAEGMSVRSFWRHVAGMGGFLGRRCDGEPGWKSLWAGWQRLETLVQGAKLGISLAR